jgi:hypothetical protein
MLIGALLVLTWLVLLIRYPLRAVPISLGAVLGLAVVAGWVVWQEQREQSLLAQLQVQISFDSRACPGAQPLRVTLHNQSDKALRNLRWETQAFAPGDRVNLVERAYDAPRYQGPGNLQPGESWESCMPAPRLRSGYRASSLEFRAERLEGSFGD